MNAKRHLICFTL